MNRALLTLASLAWFACAPAPLAARDVTPEEQVLADRVAAMEQAYALRHADEAYLSIAHPDFMIVIFVGAVESLEMVVGTSTNLQVTRWDHTLLEARTAGNTAILTFRLEVEGTILDAPIPPVLIETHTLMRENEDAEWQLLQTTMTPLALPEQVFEGLLDEALAGD